jgi:hypothetical protein
MTSRECLQRALERGWLELADMEQAQALVDQLEDRMRKVA